MKVLVIGYGHIINDKRVARTVDVLRQCGLVHYQYWEDSETKNEEELSNVKKYPLNRNSMKGLGRYGKRLNFDKEISETSPPKRLRFSALPLLTRVDAY